MVFISMATSLPEMNSKFKAAQALTLGPDDNRIHAYALGDWKTDKGVMNFNHMDCQIADVKPLSVAIDTPYAGRVIAEPLSGDRPVNVGRIEFWT